MYKILVGIILFELINSIHTYSFMLIIEINF